MANTFAKKFGKVYGKAFNKALDAHSQAIEFLRSAQQVIKYVAGEATETEENTILSLRAELKWFDCALAVLEGLPSELNDYEEAIREEAFSHLRMFYRPSRRQIQQASDDEAQFHSTWGWLTEQHNPLLNSFLATWKGAYTVAKPMLAACSIYENGATYQEFRFNLQKSETPVTCRFSFNWVVEKGFIEDKFWGKIEVATPQKIRDCFTVEQQKQFFAMLHIDLYTFNKDDKNWLGQDLKLDGFGEFAITSNWQKIKQALDENILHCALKLAAS